MDLELSLCAFATKSEYPLSERSVDVLKNLQIRGSLPTPVLEESQTLPEKTENNPTAWQG